MPPKWANLAFYGLCFGFAALVSEQVWDRGDPVEFLSVQAQPDHVAADDSVCIDVAVRRHKRCS